jgi:hypothetical protein
MKSTRKLVLTDDIESVIENKQKKIAVNISNDLTFFSLNNVDSLFKNCKQHQDITHAEDNTQMDEVFDVLAQQNKFYRTCIYSDCNNIVNKDSYAPLIDKLEHSLPYNIYINEVVKNKVSFNSMTATRHLLAHYMLLTISALATNCRKEIIDFEMVLINFFKNKAIEDWSLYLNNSLYDIVNTVTRTVSQLFNERLQFYTNVNKPRLVVDSKDFIDVAQLVAMIPKIELALLVDIKYDLIVKNILIFNEILKNAKLMYLPKLIGK